MRKFLFVAAALAVASPATAKEVTIKMLNSGPGGAMVFSPAMVQLAPGDTVKFVPTDPGHNAESIPSMLPAGAAPFRGKFNQEIDVKFDKPGVFGVKCLPHYAMGMIALIQVGAASPNLAEAKAAAASLPGLAKKRMEPLIAMAK